jgi:hypothetical protein
MVSWLADVLRAETARAPAGLEAQGDPFPALKRRAIFRLSLRDKVVCANFILFSKRWEKF